MSSGVVQITQDLSRPIEGKHVIVVEDIVDTGHTVHYLLENLATRRPASIKLASLLHKPERAERQVTIDYLGFTIPNKFVVGYGLDIAQQYRNLPFIGYVQSTHEARAAGQAPGGAVRDRQAVGSDLDPGILLSRIAELICQLIDAKACSVMLLDADRKRLLAKAAYGLRTERMHTLSFAVGEGVAGWVVERGEPALIADVAKDSRFVALPANQTPIASMLCVPLLARGERVGVVTATSRAQSTRSIPTTSSSCASSRRRSRSTSRTCACIASRSPTR